MDKGAQPRFGWHELLWKEAANAPRQILGTKAGPLFLQDHCTTVLVERLKANSGLHAFAHLPEREYQLLLTLAKRPDTELTLACTPTREIVGQVTLVPADGWWQGSATVHCLHKQPPLTASASISPVNQISAPTQPISCWLALGDV
jgi:hypothetical protein